MINIAANKHADVTADVRGELREAILSELGVRGLGDAERLADALGVEALTARALLRRSSWSLEEAAWVVTTLSLPVIVTVKRAVE